MRNIRSETGYPASLLNRFWLFFFPIFHLPGWQTETAAAPLQHERIMWSYPKTLLSFVILCSLEITDREASYRWWHLWGSDINSLCATQTSLNLTDKGNNSKAPCSSCKNSTDCLSFPSTLAHTCVLAESTSLCGVRLQRLLGAVHGARCWKLPQRMVTPVNEDQPYVDVGTC